MGTKERNFHSLPRGHLPRRARFLKDNFYRRLRERLDLSFVRELVEDRYATSGRPSVDSEVLALRVLLLCLTNSDMALSSHARRLPANGRLTPSL
jgi:hypothetical protein